MTDLAELRRLVSRLLTWAAESPASVEVAFDVGCAIKNPSAELLGMRGPEVKPFLVRELDAQLSALPAEVGERLRLLGQGLAACESLHATMADWGSAARQTLAGMN
jgi:hypothetical protein